MLCAKFVLFSGLLSLLAYLGYLDSGRRLDWDEIGSMMMLVMLIAAMLEIMVLASWIFQNEVKWNTLSSIALLPHSIQRMTYAKVAGCSLTLIPALPISVSD